MDLCEPHRERGLSIPAAKTVAGTLMCEACLAGAPVSDLLDELFEILLRVRRKSYGTRSPNVAELIRRRSERVRAIRPRAAWNRGKKRPPRLTVVLKKHEPRLDRRRGPHPRPSLRQPEILAALARGLSAKKIATELGISERTVKFHLSCLFKKSGTNNRMNLLLWHLGKTGAIAPAPPENPLIVQLAG